MAGRRLAEMHAFHSHLLRARPLLPKRWEEERERVRGGSAEDGGRRTEGGGTAGQGRLLAGRGVEAPGQV